MKPPSDAAPAPTHPARPVSLVLLAITSGVLFAIAHPTMGLSDSDALAYVIGARSLASGHGYRDLLGAPLNHWPPGYSWLLSHASDPLVAAWWINTTSFAMCVALLFHLATRAGWARPTAYALCTWLAAGLMRGLASQAKPDILTYAVFFFAVTLVSNPRRVMRLFGAALLGALIPIKAIAVTFIPGLVAATVWMRGWQDRRGEHLVYAAFWLAGLLSWTAFNYVTTGAWTPDTVHRASWASVASEAGRFASSLLREWIAYWYGSIRSPLVLIPFALTALLGVACLLTLRHSTARSESAPHGLAVLSLSWGLECVRVFYADARLMGYGLVLIVVGFRPRAGSSTLWIVFAAASFALGVYNASTVEMSGVNHPRYRHAALQLQESGLLTAIVATNGEGLLDVHAGVASYIPSDISALHPGALYVAFTLPNYDGIMQPIRQPAALTDQFEPILTVDGATVYRRAASDSRSDTAMKPR